MRKIKLLYEFNADGDRHLAGASVPLPKDRSEEEVIAALDEAFRTIEAAYGCSVRRVYHIVEV